MKLKSRKIINALGILSAVGVAVVIVIMAIASSYSVIADDDFDYAMQTGRNTGFWQYIAASFKYMQMVYFNWQGTFFSEFLNALLNPVNVGGFPEMRVLMTLNCILAFSAIIFLVWVLTERAGKERWGERLIICGLVVFVVSQYDVFPEIFFWYTGAVVLAVPLSLGCIAMGLLILAKRRDSLGMAIASWVLGFLAAGGTLAVSGTLCYAALIVIFYYYLVDKRFDKRSIIAFCFYFAASLINTVAPGNYVRKDAEGGAAISLGIGLKNTWTLFRGEIDYMLHAYNFAAILVAFVACGVVLAAAGHDRGGIGTGDSEGSSGLAKVFGNSRAAWYATGIPGLLLPFICAFPVVLGYGVPWIPDRCRYVFYVALALGFGNFCLILGHILGSFLGEKRNICAAVLLAVSVIILATSSFEIRSYRTVRVIKGLYDHVYQDNLKNTKETFEYLKAHKGEAVEVDVPLTSEEIEYAYTFYLTDDPTDRINRSVRWAFELESVRNVRGE
jgi:hypothetical protein